jgi:predicted DNA-binding protein (UPF0251 family)
VGPIVRKVKPRIVFENLPISIPVDVLQDRDLSALEAIVVYLKDHHKLTYSQIAQLLNRDDRTVWTTYKRASKKVVRNE